MTKCTTPVSPMFELPITKSVAKIIDNTANEPLRVKIARISDDVEMPMVANPGDAGIDLRSNVRVDVPPGRSVLVGTGLKMAIPNGWCGQINPRSGLASTKKIVVGARVVDSGYRGEVMINIINHGDETFEIVKGDRIAQILFLPVLTAIEEVRLEDLDETTRGAGGFGSTGVK